MTANFILQLTKQRCSNLLKKQAELANQIEVAEERWLELHELLETMPALD